MSAPHVPFQLNTNRKKLNSIPCLLLIAKNFCWLHCDRFKAISTLKEKRPLSEFLECLLVPNLILLWADNDPQALFMLKTQHGLKKKKKKELDII